MNKKRKINPIGTGQGHVSKEEWNSILKKIRGLDSEFKKKKKRV